MPAAQKGTCAKLSQRQAVNEVSYLWKDIEQRLWKSPHAAKGDAATGVQRVPAAVLREQGGPRTGAPCSYFCGRDMAPKRRRVPGRKSKFIQGGRRNLLRSRGVLDDGCSLRWQARIIRRIDESCCVCISRAEIAQVHSFGAWGARIAVA